MMVKECMSYDTHKRRKVPMLKILGMDGASMDYAIHGHAVAHIPTGQSKIECVVSHREDGLLLHMPNGKLPPLPTEHVHVHFEINHSYFDGLHKAMNCLNEYALCKLMPSNEILKVAVTGRRLTQKEEAVIRRFTLDQEYQMNALQRMISSDHRVPFLAIGPFGTGKTRILAAAVSALLCNTKSHILVCAYQNTCANSIYEALYPEYPNDMLRLVPTEQVERYIQVGRSGVILMRNITIDDILRKRVTVTTFLTAKNLRQLEIAAHKQLYFSHVLIDEGAQAREPESIGALAVVKENTKIVIVGDHMQVSHF